MCMEEAKKATRQAALASLAAWEKWDGREQLKKIEASTLILWGEEDRSYDWAQQEILRNGIEHSKLEVITGCAHNAHMESPKAVNSALLRFL